MNLGDTIAPTSDQMDAIDLTPYGPDGRTFTVKGVRAGNAEQPVQIDLVEFDRPWRPGKSMRRVLVAIWGADGRAYAGRRLTLFCDPSVKYGGIAVGGVRIAAMSGIDKPQTVILLVTRGKSAPFVVAPLADVPTGAAPIPTPDDIAAETDEKTLRNWWIALADHPDLRDLIQARATEVRADAERAAQIDREAADQ